MAKLIDANALMAKIKNSTASKAVKAVACVFVNDAPTVDAVEVVHGKWILKSRVHKMLDDVDEEFYVECNLCNREEYVCFEFEEQKMLDYAKQHFPYCHCGAKMDGERREGECK